MRWQHNDQLAKGLSNREMVTLNWGNSNAKTAVHARLLGAERQRHRIGVVNCVLGSNSSKAALCVIRFIIIHWVRNNRNVFGKQVTNKNVFSISQL